MAQPTSVQEPVEAAGSERAAAYFKFDTRLDYYMKLAEEPSVLDGTGYPKRDPLRDSGRSQDADMLDTGTIASPDVLTPGSSESLPGASAHAGSRPYSVPFGSPGQPPSGPVISRWTSRAGAFQVTPDGRRSYFGPTSYLHFFPSSSMLWDPILRRRGRDPGVNKLLLAPEYRALDDQLVDAFFTYDNLFLDAFDKSVYLRDKARFEAGQDAFLYSHALGYAILAVGLLYTRETDSMSLPDGSKEDFASQARRLLHAELEAPSVSTILTLIVLCSLSAAEALDDQGWFYSGTALRLIPALGLDRNDGLSHPMEDKSTLRTLQRSIVAGATCLDTIWHSWCGRSTPGLASFPSLQSEDENSHHTREPSCAAASSFIALGFIHRDMLWQSAQEEPKFDQVWAAMEQWTTAILSSRLDEQAERRISALTLQSLMHFHGMHIQLHQLQPNATTATLSSSAGICEYSLGKCIYSGNEISHLQQLFRKRHGLGRLHPLSIHPMLAASLIHVQSFAKSPVSSGESKQARQNVLRSIQIFGEVAETMNAGSRALEIVIAAQREWSK
ncbi:hypothetical protein B0J13DRAFT_558430 [Dactylonectria estremocensis]|uniref:Xylanolytic transcriptional activator regulatory domain-containing protein n=1 Tax=Dactylonectria estremocensis TaxID=1079267 RepID=A0A9P9EHQ1_9HYPO|nr:hypothetical protein B0J13DRAFT_558430 [Dactylonectria estremocensis]